MGPCLRPDDARDTGEVTFAGLLSGVRWSAEFATSPTLLRSSSTTGEPKAFSILGAAVLECR